MSLAQRVNCSQIAAVARRQASTKASSVVRSPAQRIRFESRRNAGTGLGAPGSSNKPMITTRNLVIIGVGVGGIALGAALLGGFTGVRSNENKLKASKKAEGMLTGKTVDYQKVYDAIAASLEEEAEDYDDGSYAPVLIRLAWHASGTYHKDTGNGGSNGATMRFAPEANHGANAGLIHARNKLDKIKAKFPDVSLSDIWTLGGVVAVQEMGGPAVPWRPGRQDAEAENCAPDGRLPDGDKGADHIRWVFYKMGFNDQEIVALSGAHAVGRCHTDRSGFDGPWTHSPVTFSNEYYKLLLESKWSKRKWDGPLQYQDKESKSLMMLETDMALTKDKAFRQYTELYAKDEGKFFDDFAKAFGKLIELGVPSENFSSGYLKFRSSSEAAPVAA